MNIRELNNNSDGQSGGLERTNNFEALQQEVESLRQQLKHLQTYGSQINVNLDNRSEDAFDREFNPAFINQLRNQIFETFWEENFYYFDAFDHQNGWIIFEGTPTVSGAGLTMTANNGNNYRIGAGKFLPLEGAMSAFDFNHESRFRTNLFINLGTDLVGMEYGLAVGSIHHPNLSNTKHYGFMIEDGAIHGSVSNGTTTEKVFLETLENEFPRVLEARFYPGDRVDFYMSRPRSDIQIDAELAETGTIDFELNHVGTIKGGLPIGAMDVNWLSFRLSASNNTTKTVEIRTVEYAQKNQW